MYCQAHSRVGVSAASDNLRKSSCCLGADTLLTLLGNYCHSHDIKTSVTIGVVGKHLLCHLVNTPRQDVRTAGN